jgi:hypothetical protein
MIDVLSAVTTRGYTIPFALIFSQLLVKRIEWWKTNR